MTKASIFAAALLAAVGLPSQAQSAKHQALPAIVQRYVDAVQNTPNTFVDAKLAGTSEGASLTIAAPNKIKIVSAEQGRTVTAVSDGTQVREWDAVYVATSPAPATLDKLDPPMPLGAVASIATSLLTDSTSITDYANLHDVGMTRMQGKVVHKVVSVEDGNTARFWLDADTGLPLQVAYTGGRHDRVVVLHYWPFSMMFGQPYDARRMSVDYFQMQPPVGLKVYVPKPTPTLLPVGTDAPDFALPRAEGRSASTLALSSLKGKVVLLDFWASWCRPCKKTMPHIQALRQTLGPKGLAVLSINTWDSAPKMQAFLQAHPQYTSTFLYDATPGDGSVASSKYHVWGIPTVYVIGKDGKVAGAFIGDEPEAATQIEQTLARLGVQ